VSDEAYEQSLRAIEQVIADETESDEILRRAVDLLHGGFDSYSWVGVYFVEGHLGSPSSCRWTIIPRLRPGPPRSPSTSRARD